ncbi:MFS transporter [Micromonospora sp. NPDC004704]
MKFTSAGRQNRGRTAFLILALSIGLLAFNLRPLVTSAPPVFNELQQQFGLSAVGLSFLAAAPVACFGLFAVAAVPLARRLGEGGAITLALAVLATGVLFRGAYDGVLVYPATIASAAGIAILNVLVLTTIRRRDPARTGTLIGIYLSTLYLGAAAGSGASIPVYEWSNGSLLVTLGIWSLPALLTMFVWLPQLRTRRHTEIARAPKIDWQILRQRFAWQVTLFMGLQSAIYYAMLSWLPTILQDRGLGPQEAGYLTSLLNLAGLATAWAFPVVADRLKSQRSLVAVAVVLGATAIAGVTFAPLATAAYWCLLMGLALGGALGLATYFSVTRSESPEATAVLTSVSQTLGYVLALVGPLLVGLLHSVSGRWSIPVAVLLGVMGLELLAGLAAARPYRRHEGRPVALPPERISS